jgi:hypothetical protein
MNERRPTREEAIFAAAAIYVEAKIRMETERLIAEARGEQSERAA